MKDKTYQIFIFVLSTIIFILLIGCSASNQQEPVVTQTVVLTKSTTVTPTISSNKKTNIQIPTLFAQATSEAIELQENAISTELSITYEDEDDEEITGAIKVYKITEKTFPNLSSFSDQYWGKLIDIGYSPQKNIIVLYNDTYVIEVHPDRLITYYAMEVDVENDNALAISPDGSLVAYTEDDLIHINKIGSGSWDRIDSYALYPDYDHTKVTFTPDGEHFIVTSIKDIVDDKYYINFTLYDIQGNALFTKTFFNSYVQSSFYHVTENNKLFFITHLTPELRIPEYAYDVYVFDLNRNLLTTSYVHTEFGSPREIKTTLNGYASELPKEEQLPEWFSDSYADNTKFPQAYADYCVPIPASANVYTYDDYFRQVTANDETSIVIQYHLRQAISLQLVDKSTCEVITEIPFNSIYGLQFSSNDRYFAYTDGITTYIWDLFANEDYDETVRGDIPNKLYNRYVFNADSTRLVASMQGIYGDEGIYPYKDYTLDVIDLESMETIMTIQPNDEYLVDLVATNDPDIIIASDIQGTNIWNIATGELIKHFNSKKFVYDPNSEAFWVIAYNTTLTEIDFRTGDILNEIRIQKGEILSSEIKDQGKQFELVLWGSSSEADYSREITISIDAANGDVIDIIGINDFTVNNYEEVIDQIDSGSRISSTLQLPGEFVQETKSNIITHTGRTYFFWDKQTNQFIGQIDFEFTPKEVVISPNALFVAVQSEGGRLYFYRIRL